MSLNDSQIEDLENNDIIDDVVQTPSPLPTTKEEITIVPETDELRGQAQQLTKEYEEKLPMMDVSFKLVEGQNAKIVDLEDVEQQILGEDKISQGTADDVNASFEGLFDGPITRLHYTQMPTKINLDHVKKHMRTRISLECAALVSQFRTLIDQPIEDAKRVIAELQNNYLVYIRAEAIQLAEKAVTLPGKIAESKNLLVQVDRDFVNLSKMDLRNFPPGAIVGQDNSFSLWCGALKKLFADDKFATFVHSVAAGGDPRTGGSLDDRLEYKDCAVTVDTLVKFYQNSQLIDYLEKIDERAASTIEQMEKLQGDGQGLADNPDGIRQFLTSRGEEIKELSQYHVDIVGRVLDLNYFNFLAGSFFEFFEKQ